RRRRPLTRGGLVELELGLAQARGGCGRGRLVLAVLVALGLVARIGSQAGACFAAAAATAASAAATAPAATAGGAVLAARAIGANAVLAVALVACRGIRLVRIGCRRRRGHR